MATAQETRTKSGITTKAFRQKMIDAGINRSTPLDEVLTKARALYHKEHPLAPQVAGRLASPYLREILSKQDLQEYKRRMRLLTNEPSRVRYRSGRGGPMSVQKYSQRIIDVRQFEEFLSSLGLSFSMNPVEFARKMQVTNVGTKKRSLSAKIIRTLQWKERYEGFDKSWRPAYKEYNTIEPRGNGNRQISRMNKEQREKYATQGMGESSRGSRVAEEEGSAVLKEGAGEQEQEDSRGSNTEQQQYIPAPAHESRQGHSLQQILAPAIVPLPPSATDTATDRKGKTPANGAEADSAQPSTSASQSDQSFTYSDDETSSSDSESYFEPVDPRTGRYRISTLQLRSPKKP
ncbi:hypothetical protein CBS101457_002803 [Exobasidium rhododendri]|nr:hypothetical protein CBS101457_002803 [Exobasidium rhododendri]